MEEEDDEAPGGCRREEEEDGGGAPRKVAPRSLLPVEAGGDLYGRKAGSASSSSSSSSYPSLSSALLGKSEVDGADLAWERGGRFMILDSTGLEEPEEEEEAESDLAGPLGGRSGE